MIFRSLSLGITVRHDNADLLIQHDIFCVKHGALIVFIDSTLSIIVIQFYFVQEEHDEKAEEDKESEEEESEEPLDLSWPDTCRARLFYIVLAPILFPLAFSTPDVRRPVR